MDWNWTIKLRENDGVTAKVTTGYAMTMTIKSNSNGEEYDVLTIDDGITHTPASGQFNLKVPYSDVNEYQFTSAIYDLIAVDLDTKLAELVARYLAALGRSGSATTVDILAEEIPRGPWNAVLLLKMVPTLERQERGSASRLIRTLDAARIVVSFPRASLGGRRKGMDAQYEALMGRIVEGAHLEVERHAWASESAYVCRRKG